MFKILVADDNQDFLESVKTVLHEFRVLTSNSIIDANQKLSPDLDAVLLDLVFDDSQPEKLQGMDFLPQIHNLYPDLPIIIMTNYTSTDISFLAGKAGATDFLSKKDLNWIEWKNRIKKYCEKSVRIRELKLKTETLENKYDETQIIGSSQAIEYVRKQLKDLAQNSVEIPILITGETGTGKNLAVKYFRKHSPRKDKPYKEFSISELSETVLESELFGHVKGAFTGADKDKKGLFEEADGGILFLDEIGDYDLKIQKKIIRFIEDKTISPVGSTHSKKLDVQLVMATNRNLTKLISEEKFREDLYYRINKVKIELLPLRERKEDIVFLTDYFFNYFKEKEKTNLLKIIPDVYEILKSYKWLGNVRELQSVILAACTRARLSNDKELSLRHLPEEIVQQKEKVSEKTGFPTINTKIVILELEEIERALEKANGKKSEAAKMLGMSLDQMRYRVQRVIDFRIIEKFLNIKQAYYKILSSKTK